MPIRNIIRIDEEKCNGCGQCVVDCAEGALAIIDGKAKLVKDSYCDGLGACIGGCPTGALVIEQREAPEFELPEHLAHVSATAAAAPAQHVAQTGCPSGGNGPTSPPSGGCPGARSFQFQQAKAASIQNDATAAGGASALTHWPIQLHLVNFQAPQFQERDILIAADCSAFACGAFHPRLLAGKAVAIACPKLDDPSGYVEKLIDMFAGARPTTVTVVRMEVPCCRGITQWVASARQAASSAVPIEEIILGVQGDIVARNMV